MSANDLVKIIVKLGGMALIVLSVLNFSELLTLLLGNSAQYSTLVVVASFVVKFVIPASIGIAFLQFGGLITNRLISGESTPPSDMAYVRQLEQVGISLLGVYLLFISASDAVNHAAYLFRVRALVNSGELMASSMSPDTFAAVVATAAEIVVALWLILGSRGLVVTCPAIFGPTET